MSPKKKNRVSGVTFHTPLPGSLLKSEPHNCAHSVCEIQLGFPKVHSLRGALQLFVFYMLCIQECLAEVEDASKSRRSPSQSSARMWSTGRCVRAEKRDEVSPSESKLGARQDWLSHTSPRQLQMKIETENRKAKDIIRPLLDTENGLMKELDQFLSQRDVTELRRRELQHKRWTERVWSPLQERVEAHVSSCGRVKAKMRQSLYNHYLHHCNTKGFVFLETYDPTEYNPFLLNIRKPHHFKLSTAALKDPLYLQSHERLKEKRTIRSCEAGCKCSLPKQNRPLSESVTSQAGTLLQASSNYSVCASAKTPAKNKSEGRKSSRLDTIPYHIRAAATPDGRCHQAGCWFSRNEHWQQPASLNQSLPTSK